MENNKFERIIYRVLRILGTVAIIGGFLGTEEFDKHYSVKVGHIVYISPTLIVSMIVSIILYQLFIKILQKHISISKKNI